MKSRSTILFLLLLGMLIFVCISAFSAISAAVSEPAVEKINVLQFVYDHWEWIALTVSEILAFLPSKISGVLQSIWLVIKPILEKKKG